MLLSTNERRLGKGWRRIKKAVNRHVRAVSRAINKAWKASVTQVNDAWEKARKQGQLCRRLRRRFDSRCRKGVNAGYAFLKKSINGVAKVVASSIRGAWNWMLAFFDCFGMVRVLHGVGYGTSFVFTAPKTFPAGGIAFGMSYSRGYSHTGIRNLFTGQALVGKRNIVFGMSLVLGAIPNFQSTDGALGGIRTGAAFGGGLACSASGCKLFISVGVALSAMLIRGWGGVPSHPWCIFGPQEPWTDSICFTPLPAYFKLCTTYVVENCAAAPGVCFKCFETIGVAVTAVCCEFILNTQKNTCR